MLQRIHAKALALQDETGAVSVIVTTDLVGLPKSVADEMAARAEASYKIPRARLVLNSSHTHSAPVVGTRVRPAYVVDARQEKVIAAYTGSLIERVHQVIGAALKDLSPATLAFNQGFAGSR